MTTIKAVESTATDSELSSSLEIDAPDSVKENIGEYLVEQILASTSESKSPVAGYGSFKQLSKKYKEKKEESGREGVPNLDYEGDMLGSLGYELTEDGIKIGIFGNQAPKADGHNNFSGDSELPLRRFLPDVGESFRKDIDQEIALMIADKAAENAAEDLDESEIEEALEVVQSRDDFYAMLSDLTGIEENYLIKSAVLSTPKLFNKIKEMGLTKYLR